MRHSPVKQFLVFLVLLLACSGGVAVAQDGLPQTLSDPDTMDIYSPKRKPNGEWILGWMTGATLFDSTETRPEYVDVRSFFQFGYGGAIPLADLGTVTTLWLKLAAQLGMSIKDNGVEPDFQVDISIPIHAVFSYGALRRKSIAWGGSVGLGVNVARRFQFDAFTFAPSVLAEIQYSPRAVYGLRLLMDVLPGSIEEGVGYHSWAIQFFAGF